MPAPTSRETYLIYHPNSKTYLGIASDNTTVIPSATPGNAQLVSLTYFFSEAITHIYM